MSGRDSKPEGSWLLSIVSGLVLFAALFFGLGLAIATYRLPPYEQIREVVRIAESLLRHGEVIAEDRRMRPPEGAARTLAVVHDPSAAMGEGHYALLGWDSRLGTYSVRLHDAAGTLVHTWPIDETSFSDLAQHNQNAPHAMLVMEDGSILVSFDWIGLMARLTPCGEAVWVEEGFYHHSFSRAADGGVWTWFGEGTAYGQFQDIVKFDPADGEVVTRISLVDDVIARSPEAALAFSMYPDFPFVADADEPRDIFHPNDVEELLPEMAEAFPMFEAGDLLLSIRELDMVAVISQGGEMKWVQQGPWLKQHDPDFEPDGRIVVYDNSRHRPRSLIMAVDPATREVVDAIEAFDGPFKSAYRGKHQGLPNGNRLITVPEQGQAIEVTPDGAVAVEFNNVSHVDPAFNEDMTNARWLPEGFFEEMPVCATD